VGKGPQVRSRLSEKMKLGASGGKNNEGIGALGKTQPGYYGASTVRHE
jgi:hypothetical protein